MQSEPHIEMFTLGMWQTNCYVVWVEGGDECWLVDAGFEPGPMIDAVNQRGLQPSKLILTHGHLDHVAGMADITAAFAGISVLIHPDERTYPGDPVNNLSQPFGMPMAAPDPTGTIQPGDDLTLGGLTFEVRHTPGHSPGGITLYQPDTRHAIVGDTLFAGSIGRYDFSHSDGAALMRSIQTQLLSVPDDVNVHPGHGPTTTIGTERRSNPFIN